MIRIVSLCYLEKVLSLRSLNTILTMIIVITRKLLLFAGRGGLVTTKQDPANLGAASVLAP